MDNKEVLKRIETFIYFPIKDNEFIKKLAESGFCYKSRSNEIECQYCNLKIDENKLNIDINPNLIHINYSPNCEFINRVSFDKYKTLEERNKSFENNNNVFTRDFSLSLALCGFYYITFKDVVKCHYCGLLLKDWKKDDDIIKSHEKFNKECLYLKELKNLIQLIHINKCSFVLFNKKHDTLEERIETYKNCDKNKYSFFTESYIIKLSESGLYWVKEDNVACFDCGLGLKGWEVDSIPFIEHSRFLKKKCRYLENKLSIEVIDLIKSIDIIEINRNITLENENRPNEIEKPLKTFIEVLIEKSVENKCFNEELLKLLLNVERQKIDSKEIKFDGNLNKNENRNRKYYLSEKSICIFCKKEISNILSYPCNHVFSCEKCYKKRDKCCVCSENIEMILNITADKETFLKLKKCEIFKENERLKKMKLCTICSKNEKNIVFIPCGHISTCKECSKIKNCNICNKNILAVTNYFN